MDRKNTKGKDLPKRRITVEEKEKLIKHILKRKDGIPSWEYREEPIFEIIPKDFLKFAKSDLKIKAKRSSINVLSNVKRAIDSQIDSILFVLGYLKQSKKDKWNFPKKIEFVNSLGITSPNILKKINRVRNLLEHEYKYPSKEKVEDAIDVTELFLSATERMINREVDHVFIEVSTNRGLIETRERNTRLDVLNLYYDSKKHLFKIELGWSSLIVIKKGKIVSSRKIPNLEKDFVVEEDDQNFHPLLKKYIEFIKKN